MRSVRLICALLLAATGLSAHGDLVRATRAATPSEPEADFTLEAQPLDKALAAFSRLTGIQMLYDSELVAGHQSKAVTGRMSAQAALLRMLEGTDLRARFTSGGAVVITAARSPDLRLDTLHVEARPVIGQRPIDPRFVSYASMVQRDAIAALKRDPEVAKDRYRITVGIWLRPDGTIAQSTCIGSSGNAERDRTFLSALARVRVSGPPPPGLPQPLRIEFHIR